MLFLYLMTVEIHESEIAGDSDKLICESCGAEFSCGANVGECWCFSVEVKAETLAELRDNYKSCLCEDCLNNLPKA